MNCVFKGFFIDAAAVELAYYSLRQKQLVTDLETSDLSAGSLRVTQAAPQIAYATEGNTMLATPGDSMGVATTAMLSNNAPQAALLPFLEKNEKASESNAFYLYGHCRKKDLDAVKSCLRNNGAFSVLTAHTSPRSQLS